MAKIIFFISFLCLSFSAFSQKPFFFTDKAADLSSFPYFFIEDQALPMHQLEDPFLDKNKLNDIEYSLYSLYYELSLKNMTITDGDHGSGVLSCFIYTGTEFHTVTLPKGYKAKKLRGEHLIIDLCSGGEDHHLVWRGWISLDGIKKGDRRQNLQHAVFLLMAGLNTNVPNPPDNF